MEPESYSQIPASFVIFITCVDNTRKHVWRNLHNKAPMGVVNCEIFFYLCLVAQAAYIGESVSI